MLCGEHPDRVCLGLMIEVVLNSSFVQPPTEHTLSLAAGLFHVTQERPHRMSQHAPHHRPGSVVMVTRGGGGSGWGY